MTAVCSFVPSKPLGQQISELHSQIRHAKDLTPAARLVAAELLAHLNINVGYAWPSVEQIASNLGMTKKTVTTAIKAIQGRFFRVERAKVSGRNRVNKYFPIIENPDARVAPAELVSGERDDREKRCKNYHHEPGEGAKNGVKNAPEMGKKTTPERIYINNIHAPEHAEARAATAPPAPRSIPHDAHPPVNALAWRKAFKARFGRDAYTADAAGCTVRGSRLVAPSKFKAVRVNERYRRFWREQGFTGFLSAEDPEYFCELPPSATARRAA